MSAPKNPKDDSVKIAEAKAWVKKNEAWLFENKNDEILQSVKLGLQQIADEQVTLINVIDLDEIKNNEN